MRHSKFILKRIWLWDIWLHFSCFLCGRGCGCYQDISHSPWLQRAPRFCELAPPNFSPRLVWGGGQWGRRWAADSGALGPTFTPGRYCTQGKCVHKGPYGSLLHEAFGQGGRMGGGEAARRHTSRGHWPHPSQTAGWLPPGKNGELFLLAGLLWCPAWGGLHWHSLLISMLPLSVLPLKAGQCKSQQAFLGRSLWNSPTVRARIQGVGELGWGNRASWFSRRNVAVLWTGMLTSKQLDSWCLEYLCHGWLFSWHIGHVIYESHTHKNMMVI